ncbi:MAG: thioredoxin domain-containing protein [Syntrophomonadaceae bacterium]
MKRKPEAVVSPEVGSPLDWAKLAALGALSGLWALFLWEELVRSRSGGGSFCGGGGRLDCSPVWNGAFATAVHHLTGMPIAGLGLVWSLVAFVLPLAGLTRRAAGEATPALQSGVRWTAAAGLLAVAVMLAASAIEGHFCIGCIGTYLIVAAYAAIALLGWRSAGFPDAGRGAALAAGGAAVAFVLLLYPGLHTPKTSAEAGREAVAAAAGAASSASTPIDVAAPVSAPASGAARTGTGDPGKDRALEELVASLDPGGKQLLANSLAIYRNSSPAMMPAPRSLVGSTVAPVRITDFTDILCDHCASLYQTLQTLRENTSPGSFSVDARQFPLDGRCNPQFEGGKGDDVRCVAALARICVEPSGKEPEFAGALFARQKGLTREAVLQIGSQFMPREKLAACVASPAAHAGLEQDLAAARPFDSDGTPIVSVNGRRGTSFGPFLYAMILTKGNPDHPAFEALPPGNASAHMH